MTETIRMIVAVLVAECTPSVTTRTEVHTFEYSYLVQF